MKPKKTGYQKTLEFLKKYEGFKDTVYLDGNGIPTIGYGFTDPSLIKKGYISRADADKRLEQEVRTMEKELRSKVKGWENLADDSKTALLSYRFNYPAGFKDTTRFMLNWNAGDYSAAIKEVDAGMNDENNPGLRERRLAEQALLNADPYLQGAKTQVTDNGKKMTFPRGYWDIPQYESTYQLPKQTNTVYPLNPNDRTVPSLDAWNGADSPSAGPNMPSLQKSMDERKRMFDLFSDNAIAIGKKKTLPNLRNVLDRKMEDYIAGITGVPDIYEESGYTYTPMMYSPMPVFADGKLPKFEIGKPDDDIIQYTKNGAQYNVNKNVVGAKELSVTTPDVNVVGTDQRPMYQRYDAEHSTYDPNAIKNITEFAPGIGDVQQGFDAYNAAKNGNYTEAAMLGGLLLLPNVLEKPAVYGKKFLSTALDEFARNKKGYYRIANDFLTDPIRLISDHFNGNYPLTYSLRKDFIKKRNEFFNKQMDIADAYEKVQRDKRLLRHGEDSFFYDDKAVRPNIITARSIKPAWNGSRNFYDPATHSISIPTRTNKYSNFVNFTDPKQLGIFHHEYTHSLQDPRNSKFAPYLSISKYNDNFGYYVPDMEDVKYFTGEYNPYTEAEDWFNVAKYAKQKGDLTFFEKNKHTMDADEWVANARAIKLSPGYTEKDFINYYGDNIRKELLDERSRKMAELIGYKDGKSPIRIKPANRGKLTRLKKRTGKSESELYNDGNPAHKKMVVFARNARKWKH